MKSMKLTFGLTALALGIASAASSHNVELKQSVSIGSTQLQAGQYKVEIQGDKATFKMGKSVVEVPATLGKSDQKYGTTGIVTDGAKLVEIDLGGTTDKILFSPKAGESAGGGTRTATAFVFIVAEEFGRRLAGNAGQPASLFLCLLVRTVGVEPTWLLTAGT